MDKTISQNQLTAVAIPSLLAKAIFEELKLLRKELSLVFPQDDLKNYSHAAKIRSSYKKAVKEYPPAAYGNY